MDRFRRFDNARPRDPGFYEDPIARPRSAPIKTASRHSVLAAAVLLAEFRAAPQHLMNELAVLFLIVRCICLHLSGKPPDVALDPVEIGFAINIAIFFLRRSSTGLPGLPRVPSR